MHARSSTPLGVLYVVPVCLLTIPLTCTSTRTRTPEYYASTGKVLFPLYKYCTCTCHCSHRPRWFVQRYKIIIYNIFFSSMPSTMALAAEALANQQPTTNCNFKRNYIRWSKVTGWLQLFLEEISRTAAAPLSFFLHQKNDCCHRDHISRQKSRSKRSFKDDFY